MTTPRFWPGWGALAGLLVLLLSLPAAAGPLVFVDQPGRLTAKTDLGTVELASAERLVWYLLVAAHDVPSRVRLGTAKDACAKVESGGEFLVVRVRWKRVAERMYGFKVLVPETTISKHVADGGRCPASMSYTTDAKLRATVIGDPDNNSEPLLTYDPLRELAESLSDALVRHPDVGQLGLLPEPRRLASVQVPLAIGADDEFRAQHGRFWDEHVAVRIAMANRIADDMLLGFDLVVERAFEWESGAGETDMKALYAQFEEQVDPRPARVQVGFTGQARLEVFKLGSRMHGVSSLGHGSGFVVGDAGVFRGDDPHWDEVFEALVLLHELVHHLGLGHADEPGRLMSASMSWNHAMSREWKKELLISAQLRFGPTPPPNALDMAVDKMSLMATRPEDVPVWFSSSLYWLHRRSPTYTASPTCFAPRTNLALAFQMAAVATEARDEDAKLSLAVAAIRYARYARRDRSLRAHADELLGHHESTWGSRWWREVERLELVELVNTEGLDSPACFEVESGSGGE